MLLKKSLIALALTSTLAACGSGSSDTKAPDPTTSTPIETVINGKAVKGVLANAVVSVYKFVDGAPVALTATELSDANITTDENGNYTFTVLNYEGPIKIELSPSTDPNNPTTMSCDAPAGCASTAFSEKINLTTTDPDFKLATISVVANQSTNVKANVSALTYLASKLIEAQSVGVTTESITEQSNKIASTFGIDGDITQLEPTITDDAEATATEDNLAELRYGLINAGIMSALFSGETNGDAILSTKLTEAVTDLVENNGDILVKQDDDDSFELSLTDILTGAANAAQTASDAISAAENLTPIHDLAQQQVNLANEQAYQEANVGDDGRAEIGVNVPTNGDAIAKAKGMVDDIRLFTHLFDDQTEQGANIKSQGDEYVQLLDDAGVMIEAEAQSFELLAQIANALGDIIQQYDDGTLTEEMAAAGVPIASYLTIQGATGTITFDEETATGGFLFKVNATAQDEMVKLNVSAEFSEDKKSIKLSIDGALESSGAIFTLNEGSFAQINLDTPASRESFSNDTYEGEIVSGELQLALSLAQKQTDTVTNPVTFTGSLNTKLLLVNERVLNNRWNWDDQRNQPIASYNPPTLEAKILPELLTLNGAFSSLEGDLLSATLTVNINNLDDYEAPDFKYIGKEVSDVLNITINDDTLIFTEADSVVDEEQSTITHTYSAGEQVGDWTALTSLVTKNSELHWAGTGYELKEYSRPFDAGLDVQGIIFTYAYVIGRDEHNFYARSTRITPVDQDNNGSADGYHFEQISTPGGKNIGLEYNIEAMVDNDGNINLNALVDENGQILTADGLPQEWTNVYNLNTYSSIEAFIQERPWEMTANPLTLNSSSEYFSNILPEKYYLTIDDIGKVIVFFNEEELANIAAGNTSELNPTGYLTQPLIKDAFSVDVSSDLNTVIAAIDNFTETVKLTPTNENTSYSATIEQNEWWGTTTTSIETQVSPGDESLDVNVTHAWIETNYNCDECSDVQLVYIIPQDDNNDSIADSFFVGVQYGKYFNSELNVVDWNGEVVVEFNNYQTVTSLADIEWEYLTNGINPLVNNAQQLYASMIHSRGDTQNFYSEEIGELEVALMADDIRNIEAGTIKTFDAINTRARSQTILENEQTFLDVNAALTLEAILGDYQVKLQLSGERTTLDDGVFDLAMSYRLPGEEAQRSFTVHANTEEEGRLTANNFEGVVLVLEEPEEDTTGTQVIGKILVGPTAIVAATIEDRDGLIVIVYNDETTESL